jgi:uncharacterized protein (TIGR00251 family)
VSGGGSTCLEERKGILYLRVRATPGAAHEGIAGRRGNALRVAVPAPPERGKANKAIANLLARALHVRAGQVTLQSGEGSRDKLFRIDGLTLERARAILGTLIEGTEPPEGARE